MSKAIYAAYFTGGIGVSLGLFLIGDGIISGVDIGGLKYDGNLTPMEDRSLKGAVKFTLSPGQQLITGATATSQQDFIVPLHFPPDLEQGTVVEIQTPLGPVNARFEKLRDVDHA